MDCQSVALGSPLGEGTSRLEIGVRGRIAECPRLQQNAVLTKCRSPARSPPSPPSITACPSAGTPSSSRCRQWCRAGTRVRWEKLTLAAQGGMGPGRGEPLIRLTHARSCSSGLSHGIRSLLSLYAGQSAPNVSITNVQLGGLTAGAASGAARVLRCATPMDGRGRTQEKSEVSLKKQQYFALLFPRNASNLFASTARFSEIL